MVRIALGQINTTVGDLSGNVVRMVAAAVEASEAGADLVCFPELAVTGYPPEDLVLRPQSGPRPPSPFCQGPHHSPPPQGRPTGIG